jgi:hypothetical protein
VRAAQIGKPRPHLAVAGTDPSSNANELKSLDYNEFFNLWTMN